MRVEDKAVKQAVHHARAALRAFERRAAGRGGGVEEETLPVEGENTSSAGASGPSRPTLQDVSPEDIAALPAPAEGGGGGLGPATEAERRALLVLDIDNTLADFSGAPERPVAARPGLGELLRAAFSTCDVAVWSACSADAVAAKMHALGVGVASPKPVFVCDRSHMLLGAKPLAVPWAAGKGRWDATNTLVVDDTPRTFALNEECGVPVKPFHGTTPDAASDDELHRLARYIEAIVRPACADLSGLELSRWRQDLAFMEAEARLRDERIS